MHTFRSFTQKLNEANVKDLPAFTSELVSTTYDMVSSEPEMQTSFSVNDLKKLDKKSGKYKSGDIKILAKVVEFFDNYMYDAGLSPEDYDWDGSEYKSLLKLLKV